MSPVSSSLLYHYTDKKGLWGIIKNGFKPSYSREKILTNPDAHFDFAVPMACFCDIPEELATIQRSNYGDYAIGLYDSWRIENRLNPILYLSKDSDLFNQIKKLGEITVYAKNTYEDKTLTPRTGNTITAADFHPDPEIVAELKELFYSLLIRVKPYIGPKYDNAGKLVNMEFKYYDEREYRYIFERLPVNLVYKKDTNIPEYIKKVAESEPFLCFKQSDIGRIIVKEPSDVNDVTELINNSDIIGGNKKHSAQMPIICTWDNII